MTSSRQDAWTHDEDLLLAEIVLRHIREGGTQLAAFEEVGKKLTRTSAACGFAGILLCANNTRLVLTLRKTEKRIKSKNCFKRRRAACTLIIYGSRETYFA